MGKKISVERKKKVVFALIMGSITTGIISFFLIAINIGFTNAFFGVWLKSWILAYFFVIPAILFIAPLIEKLVANMFDRRSLEESNLENDQTLNQ